MKMREWGSNQVIVQFACDLIKMINLKVLYLYRETIVIYSMKIVLFHGSIKVTAVLYVEKLWLKRHITNSETMLQLIKFNRFYSNLLNSSIFVGNIWIEVILNQSKIRFLWLNWVFIKKRWNKTVAP